MSPTSNDGGNDLYGQSVAGLRLLQQSYLRKAEEVEQIIQRLSTVEQYGQQQSTLRPVEKGEYAGYRLSFAMRLYFKVRKGQRIPIDRVVRDLLVGGVQPGKQRREGESPEQVLSQNVKITARNVPKIVKFDESSWEMWASDGIDEPHRRNRGTGKAKGKSTGGSSEAEGQ